MKARRTIDFWCGGMVVFGLVTDLTSFCAVGVAAYPIWLTCHNIERRINRILDEMGIMFDPNTNDHL